ncbi:MAG TPA: tetratricopeptide repeat protein [Chloroflexia bacterium]|nr:tetratricopeptide repeat protein [Chloroflexia bacterium]
MSTPRKIDAKTAAKRRAARRRQTRETMGRCGIIAIVAILVIGTIASVIIPGTVTAPGAVPTDVPAVNPTATQPNLSGLQSLVQLGDEAASKGNWADAASIYRSYLAQDPTDGQVHFKLGKVYLSMQPPNYLEALSELQQALSINPSAPYAQEAQSLIDQYKDNALTPSVITGTMTTLPGSITGTVTITSTGTVTGSGTLTSTVVVTGTSAAGTAPPTAPPAGGTQTP